MPPNPWSDVLVTASVAGPISFLAYYFMGRAIMALAISRDSFERLSRTDPLTGLLNRRAFAESIAAFETPYVLAVIDIDRFKAINDIHGHAAGDRVLVEAAAEFRAAFGDAAIVARIGGEEFAVALPDCGRDVATAALERAQNLLARREVSGKIAVTFSAGLSSSEGRQDYSALLTEADKALYLAKAAGRNRIVHAEDVVAVTAHADISVRALSV
jgi:diguanylate cyclase (GGDEF)-like protein